MRYVLFWLQRDDRALADDSSLRIHGRKSKEIQVEENEYKLAPEGMLKSNLF